MSIFTETVSVFLCLVLVSFTMAQAKEIITPNIPPGSIYIPSSVTEYGMLSDELKRVVTPAAFAKVLDY